MDGVFMQKMIKRVVACALIAAFVWCLGVIGDRKQLNENLIRLHVVANSDSPEDQAVKLQVRDAVMESLRTAMTQVADVEEAKTYIRENLPKLQKVANHALQEAGFSETAVVSFCREPFDTRYYDTFTLPAGVYDALRITIGAGEGHNWWCVVFPTLCLPAASEAVSAVAAGAGFSDSLSRALTGDGDLELRFFLLDWLGRMENIFHLE